MKVKQYSCVILLYILTLTTLSSLIASQTCKNSCGQIPIKYPFGTGLGCGDPRFQQYVTCNQEKLTLTTHTGCYPVTNIEYSSQVIYISDPSMSTCACTQTSKGFGLDWDAPFSFHDDTVFTLLDCSTTSSPIYRTNGAYDVDSNTTVIPQCDRTGAPICSFLFSCGAISMLNLPISTCCVYTPVDLGPSFEMDLQKLQCTSYSGFYSFNGQESNPENWKYGIALKYKFNVYNDYPSSCANCERSNGVCGYGGAYNTFVCNCPGGLNTTSDCFFRSSYNHSPRLLPRHTAGNFLIFSLSYFMVRVLF
ncbi:PREDICTED: wall-associated receptor kinase 3 [Populus euphratica]|uniref:non-specific serine/threonine protein kinase n=1 Tax=Populus euphratica TaxID=75702 RepID=A0AAJ6TCH6_POPEU|nr:PREDICTED: wall-associated receptor kinase 3 [Populus euphratica]